MVRFSLGRRIGYASCSGLLTSNGYNFGDLSQRLNFINLAGFKVKAPKVWHVKNKAWYVCLIKVYSDPNGLKNEWV